MLLHVPALALILLSLAHVTSQDISGKAGFISGMPVLWNNCSCAYLVFASKTNGDSAGLAS